MTAHFFVASSQADGDVAHLDADDSRHLATVLRARPGTAVSVADGSGTVWHGRFRGLEDGLAVIDLDSSTFVAQEAPAVTVIHALPKQRKLDEVVQRLTEVGVDRIVPAHSERSQVELDSRKAAKAVARWRAVAMAAAKQSRRARLVEVADVGHWGDVFPVHDPGVVCWEEADQGLRAVLDDISSPQRLVVAIGPEGGLTAAEVSACRLPAASLGTTVLRTETAALVAVAAVRYHYGLMEPTCGGTK